MIQQSDLNKLTIPVYLIAPNPHMGLHARKPVFGGLRTTQVQTSLRIGIRSFVIRLSRSTISRLASSNISIF